jgi:hypothetical protein
VIARWMSHAARRPKLPSRNAGVQLTPAATTFVRLTGGCGVELRRRRTASCATPGKSLGTSAEAHGRFGRVLCPGKSCPGEANPRWVLRILSNRTARLFFESRSAPNRLSRTRLVYSPPESGRTCVPALARLGSKQSKGRDSCDSARPRQQLELVAWSLQGRPRPLCSRRPSGLRLPLDRLPPKVSTVLSIERNGDAITVFIPLVQQPFLNCFRD